MSNEWVLILQDSIPYPFTCANGTTIEKGTLLTMSDPRTAAANSTKESICAGICAVEKIANNGETMVSVHRSGWFKAYCSGSVTIGDALISSSGAAGSEGNKVESAGVNGEDIVAIALETGTDGQQILVELKPFTMNLA